MEYKQINGFGMGSSEIKQWLNSYNWTFFKPTKITHLLQANTSYFAIFRILKPMLD